MSFAVRPHQLQQHSFLWLCLHLLLHGSILGVYHALWLVFHVTDMICLFIDRNVHLVVCGCCGDVVDVCPIHLKPAFYLFGFQYTTVIRLLLASYDASLRHTTPCSIASYDSSASVTPVQLTVRSITTDLLRCRASTPLGMQRLCGRADKKSLFC